MHLPNLSTILITLALVATGVSAQDEGPNYIFKCQTPGQVALTFDDGPSPFTPKLLGYLSAAKVPATFFVLATSIKENGAALKAAHDAGHQIALHSNTHADMNTLTPDKILEEYTINLKAVQDTIGVNPAMARPPFGNCNAACAKVLEGQMGLNVVQWNCDSNDWQYEGKVADQPKLFTNMEAIINPSNAKTDSFITLQHDIKDYSIEYVPKIIEMIRGKGYEFVTVEKCTGIPAYKDGGAGGAGGAAKTDGKAAAEPKTDGKAAKTEGKAAKTGGKAADKAADPKAATVPNGGKAAYVEGPPPSGTTGATGAPKQNSADKVATTFGLTFIGLISSLLMY